MVDTIVGTNPANEIVNALQATPIVPPAASGDLVYERFGVAIREKKSGGWCSGVGGWPSKTLAPNMVSDSEANAAHRMHRIRQAITNAANYEAAYPGAFADIQTRMPELLAWPTDPVFEYVRVCIATRVV